MRHFNTSGPVKPEKHYSLDPKARVDFDSLEDLIDRERYFVLHAPRQTGKTSMLLSLMRHFNEEGRYKCLYMNVEAAQTDRENVAVANRTIFSELARRSKTLLNDNFFNDRKDAIYNEGGGNALLQTALTEWTLASDKPTILFIDEIDALIGDTLVSVLRQLRASYDTRPDAFPQSIVLCGVRDVRDYRIHASSEKDPITGGSAFNIKAESIRLGNFSQAEVAALLQQHTDETGQVFEEAAVEHIFEVTGGQPFLVNALAYDTTWRDEANRDRSRVITKEMIDAAREALVLRRETHLDQLVHKLREDRVHRVIAPILAGDDISMTIRDEDVDYVYDLGLIERRPQIRIANPIYLEVIPRMLTWATQVTISQEATWYTDASGKVLDMAKLLRAFQEFFREHSEAWIERFQYKEAGPQLLLQAFLQRVINGGGRIDREYGLGMGRTDLRITFHDQCVILELKIQRGTRQATIEKALPQITRYMDQSGTKEGHLIIFDQSETSWAEKIFEDTTTHEGEQVRIWGM